MDTAVALVQAYLRVNGYFTVAEYPVLEAVGRGSHRMLTDLDLLAFRFPGAGRELAGRGERDTVPVEVFEPDPALGQRSDRSDMIVAEVKEGRAELNRAARDPAVLRAALVRFGCCSPVEAPRLVEELIRQGRASTGAGHEVRLVVFGAEPGEGPGGPYAVITLGHVVEFLQEHLRRHWDVVRHAQTKDPALSFLLTLEKAHRG
jgi:hypothetical protein